MATDFVFLHGGLQGGWIWDEAIAALRARGGAAVGRCIALDVAGCGTKRARDTRGMSLAALVDDLLADLDAAAVAGGVLVGHSQAGSILPRLVACRPGCFRGVVAVACIAPATGETALAGTIGSRLRDGQPPRPEVMMAHLRTMFCNDMDAARADGFMARIGVDAWPASAYAAADWAYESLGLLPVSYVLCERDRCVAPAHQQGFARRMHARRVHRVDAGHQVMNSRPEAFAELLLAEAAIRGHIPRR